MNLTPQDTQITEGFQAQTTQAAQADNPAIDPNQPINWGEVQAMGGQYLSKLGKYVATIGDAEIKQGSNGYYFMLDFETSHGKLREMISSNQRTMKYVQHIVVQATGQEVTGAASPVALFQKLKGMQVGITVSAGTRVSDKGVPYLNIANITSAAGFTEEVGLEPTAPAAPTGAAAVIPEISAFVAPAAAPVPPTPPVAAAVAPPVAPPMNNAPIAPPAPPTAAPVGATTQPPANAFNQVATAGAANTAVQNQNTMLNL